MCSLLKCAAVTFADSVLSAAAALLKIPAIAIFAALSNSDSSFLTIEQSKMNEWGEYEVKQADTFSISKME